MFLLRVVLKHNRPLWVAVQGLIRPTPCMYVCIRGGLLQPLHLDPQWSIVLNPYDR
jgi:hypothetical protein